jgi:hypothetical protein
MNEFYSEMVALIDKLEKTIPSEGSTEQITLSLLKGLGIAAENTDDTNALEARVAELEQFWASSVAWCSVLSKDIEKIIILYREQL